MRLQVMKQMRGSCKVLTSKTHTLVTLYLSCTVDVIRMYVDAMIIITYVCICSISCEPVMYVYIVYI